MGNGFNVTSNWISLTDIYYFELVPFDEYAGSYANILFGKLAFSQGSINIKNGRVQHLINQQNKIPEIQSNETLNKKDLFPLFRTNIKYFKNASMSYNIKYTGPAYVYNENFSKCLFSSWIIIVIDKTTGDSYFCVRKETIPNYNAIHVSFVAFYTV